MTKIAINGFGRIGRCSVRALLKREGIDIVAINDLTDPKTLAHLFKYDSVHGMFDGDVRFDEHHIIINNNAIKVFSSKNTGELPWKELDIDIVIESTGKMRTADLAGSHIKAGAKKVIISAPPQGGEVKSVVMGVNDYILDGNERIISNASCTTNNAAPMVKVLDDIWGIEWCYVTTVHSFTGDQRLHDSPHKDLRRARSAPTSIIPTTTGAAKALSKIFPALDGKIGGCGIRVPVPNGSLTDLTCILKKDVDDNESINEAFKRASQGSMRNILQYVEDPIVSIDIVNNPHSCIYDSLLTSVVGKLVKIVGWYDNEWGYSNRIADLIMKIST